MKYQLIDINATIEVAEYIRNYRELWVITIFAG